MHPHDHRFHRNVTCPTCGKMIQVCEDKPKGGVTLEDAIHFRGDCL